MQIKPILKSKRNTVILHDLPEAIPQEELRFSHVSLPSQAETNLRLRS